MAIGWHVQFTQNKFFSEFYSRTPQAATLRRKNRTSAPLPYMHVSRKIPVVSYEDSLASRLALDK